MAARVTPLRRLPPPRYPTWDLVREDPALLAREVPARWQRRSAVVAALTAAALGTASAARQGPSANRPAAVVFEHGEGKGSYGCVSVAPPAFLSEEEARQVVVSELSAAGVKLAAGDKQIPDVVRHRYYLLPKDARPWDVSKARVEESGPAAPVRLDGYDTEKRVGVVMVLEAGYRERGGLDSADVHFEGSSGEGWSSVGTFDFAEAARYLAGRINANAGGGPSDAIGVFYDPSFGAYEEMKRLGKPGPDWQAQSTQAVKNAKSKSVRELRAQVKDFAG